MTTLTSDDLLIILIEECAEIIQAATKCQRFGFNRDWPEYGVNHQVLAKEIGEMMGVADALNLDLQSMQNARETKIERAEIWKNYFETRPVEA